MFITIPAAVFMRPFKIRYMHLEDTVAAVHRNRRASLSLKITTMCEPVSYVQVSKQVNAGLKIRLLPFLVRLLHISLLEC